VATSSPARSSGSGARTHASEDQRSETVRRGALRSVSPYNGEKATTYTQPANNEVDAAIATAHDRLAILLRRAAKLCRERREDLARFMAIEMGKPIAEAYEEIQFCIWIFECYADLVEQPLQSERIRSPAGETTLLSEPLSVVSGVQPCGFSAYQDIRFAAPKLMAGNVVLLKHASSIQQCAEAAEELLQDAGGIRTAERADRTVKKAAVGMVESDPFVCFER
jgi:succinate-semialdehyde dehydrogenase / glutarate-semialdehyde dehydrogenase